MPVPTSTTKEGAPPHPPPSQPSQKSMTKAERRELQERQRAAKQLQKQQSTQSNGQPSPKPKQSSQKKDSGVKPPTASSSSAPKEMPQQPKPSGDPNTDTNKVGALRIFSHFISPKRTGENIKGDIHPTVIRLGLQFLDFTICGANARCIATLTAFKTVGHLKLA